MKNEKGRSDDRQDPQDKPEYEPSRPNIAVLVAIGLVIVGVLVYSNMA